MKTLFSYAFVLLLPFFLINPTAGVAQDFVYTPQNPAFGGSPINYQWLLSSANIQNKFEERRSRFDDPLADFQESLQRQVLRELTRDVISERFENVDLSQQGTFEFGEFSIDIVPGPNGIEIIILNLSTGESTTVTVPNV